MPRSKKPSPVHTETVCSVCGLDWDRHGDEPTTDTCIELLRGDLDRERARTTPRAPMPYPVVPYVPHPYPQPWRQPPPIWVSHQTTTNSAAGQPALGQTIFSRVNANAGNLH